MTTGRSWLMRIIRRPIKIIRNFLISQIVLTLLALFIGFFVADEHFQFPNRAQELHKSDNILFTKEQLALYDGRNGKPLYLALLGSVYDVSKGAKHYGPDCTYNFFVGRDASVAFITGEFEQFDDDKADDVVGQLRPKDMLALANWQRFYEKDYSYKGKLIGRFYDQYGNKTKYHHKYLALVEQAEQQRIETEELQTLFPDCNIQWSEENGTRVWCTERSGGKERTWKGYPRKFFEIGSNNFRCACVNEDNLQTNLVMLKEYDNCDNRAHECFYKVD